MAAPRSKRSKTNSASRKPPTISIPRRDSRLKNLRASRSRATISSWVTGTSKSSTWMANGSTNSYSSRWNRRRPRNNKEETMKQNGAKPARRLRSQAWFDDPTNPDVTAGYLERYLNFGFTREELQSGRPIIGIAQTGSDLSPCNRHHLELAKRVREGIRSAGAICFEFPVHPI